MAMKDLNFYCSRRPPTQNYDLTFLGLESIYIKKKLNQPMAPFPPHSAGCLASSFQNISSNYLEQIASSINETVPVIQRLLFYACLIMIDKTRLVHYKKCSCLYIFYICCILRYAKKRLFPV